MSSAATSDLSSLFNIENFDPQPDEELICSICRCVFNDPVECSCRHVFCRVCINSWLVQKKSCPICRKRSYAFDLETVNPLIKNMISKLTLACPNKENGCNEKLILEGYSNHVKQCPCEIVNCGNSSFCNVRCCRKELNQHENTECKYRMLSCEKDCNLFFPAAKVNDHNCVVELKKLQKENSHKMDQLKNQIEELNKELESLKKKLDDQELANNSRSHLFSSSSSSASSSSASSSLSNFSYADLPTRGNFFSLLFRDFLDDSEDQTQNQNEREINSPSIFDFDDSNSPSRTDNALETTVTSNNSQGASPMTQSPRGNSSPLPTSTNFNYSPISPDASPLSESRQEANNDFDFGEPVSDPRRRRVLKRRLSSLLSDSDDSLSSPGPQSHRRLINVFNDDSDSSDRSSTPARSATSGSRITRSLVPIPVDSSSDDSVEILDNANSPISESSYEVRVPERTWDLLERYNSSDSSDWTP